MISARYASLIAFAQSRGSDCGRDADGKFSSGNKCAVEVADVSKAAGSIAPVAASASVGAAIGSVAGLPGMAIGGALGAVFGAVHSYFMKSHSEMVADAQKTVGLTGKQVDSLARALGAGDKEKASGFVTTADAFGIWAPNDDIALVTDSNPFNRGEGDDSRHLHFEPTPDTMRSGAAATVAEKAASSVGAKTVTVSSRGPISAKSLEEAGFKKIDHKSQMMEWSGTSVYQKNIGVRPSKRAFCPTGEGNGVDNSCGSGQSSQSFPKGSQNLRDAVDSVTPAPEQVWDRSKGLAETPAPKQMDDIASEQTSYSGAALTPEAEASYGSLVDEIGRQYEALTAAGLKARAWRGEGEPYGDPPGSTKPNSNKMREEVAKTGEFSFFMTDKGFGTGDATPNHPMLRETKYKTADGEPMIANDLFRVVHDMVAHVRGGYSFSTNGEYNGMLTHASTLPEAAWPALFAETFGQNAVYEKTKQYAPQNAYASKIGPEIIRSELKKRTKSSRAKKDDGDEPLGYQHVKSRPWLLTESAESRSTDCGRDDDGRFASGNKCGGQVDMPKEDPRGRMRYDNGVQTDAARKLYQMGSSEKKLKSLVDSMGGDPKNTKVDINPPSLNISVADKDGNKLFHVDFENGRARLYPAKDLTPAEATKIMDAADEAFGGSNADTKIKVFSKASDVKKWESENAAKIKKWEDKYKFSTLLPPHQRPKKWERSISETRDGDCGRTSDGKFGSGNKCQEDAANGSAVNGMQTPVLSQLPKSQPGDPKSDMSWLSPSGDFHPVERNREDGGYRTHNRWALENGVEGGEKELMSEGWMRVVRIGDDVYASSDSGKRMTDKQVKSLKDHAISSGHKKAIYEPYSGRETTVWSSGDRSLDARHASLLAFAESRNCGQDSDGKFSKGNTCASGLAADVATNAAKGAAVGAASGFGKTFTPQGAASGAAYGAVAGAVKGIYDNKMRPTRVSARIERVGLTDEKVAQLVKGLGGTNKSLASMNGRKGLTLTIRAKGGKVSHVVDVTDKKVSIYPVSGRKELTDDQIESIKTVAAEVSPKETTVVVKTNSLSYAARLAKKGFAVAAKGAGAITATAIVSGVAPSVPDAVLGVTDLVFDTHFTDSFYRKPNAKR